VETQRAILKRGYIAECVEVGCVFHTPTMFDTHYYALYLTLSMNELGYTSRSRNNIGINPYGDVLSYPPSSLGKNTDKGSLDKNKNNLVGTESVGFSPEV